MRGKDTPCKDCFPVAFLPVPPMILVNKGYFLARGKPHWIALPLEDRDLLMLSSDLLRLGMTPRKMQIKGQWIDLSFRQ